jgi:iron complex outermembrane receptor protein
VRSPSALERYADRFPAVKFQTAAEFVGNPHLVPEKSVELNAGTTLRAAEAAVTLDVFLRNVDDYITVAPDPNLAKRLPISPDQIFRYVQADAARFAGFDLTAISAAGPWIDLRGGWSYVRADDVLFGEPLFGVPPFEQQYAIDVHNPARTRWLEVLVTSTAAQERVAATRFEVPTEGWTTIDLMAGVRMNDGLTLRAGVQNLTDQYYVNHLNSFNPFTRQRIAELGRSAYIGAEVGF